MIEDRRVKIAIFCEPPRLDRLFSSFRSFYFVTFNTAGRQRNPRPNEIHEKFRSFAFAHSKNTMWQSGAMS